MDLEVRLRHQVGQGKDLVALAGDLGAAEDPGLRLHHFVIARQLVNECLGSLLIGAAGARSRIG